MLSVSAQQYNINTKAAILFEKQTFRVCDGEVVHMSDVRKHIVFYGRVQGVGFRYTAKYLARSLELTGWVRNDPEGTVTMEVQGREALINKLLVGLNGGHFISIEWMDTKEIPLEEEREFVVKM